MAYLHIATKCRRQSRKKTANRHQAVNQRATARRAPCRRHAGYGRMTVCTVSVNWHANRETPPQAGPCATGGKANGCLSACKR